MRCRPPSLTCSKGPIVPSRGPPFPIPSEGHRRPQVADRRLSPGPVMTPLVRLAFIGNSLPRRCGIATFTTDLQQAVASSDPSLETSIVAMTDNGHAYRYPACVRLEIDDARLDDYEQAGGRAQRRQDRGGLFAARVRHLRRRQRGAYPGPARQADHARRDDPAHCPCRTFGKAARPCSIASIEASASVIVMAEKAARAASAGLSRASRQDRGHTARHSRRRLRRARAGPRQRFGFRGQGDHPDIRTAIAEQGHRDHDRRHAGGDRAAAGTSSMSCSGPPIPISSATRARPIERVLQRGVRALGHRGPCRVPRPSSSTSRP